MPGPGVAAVMPLGSSVSGQTLVHPLSSVQVILPPFSEVSMYRVRPWPLTTMVPTPVTFAARMVTPGAEAGGLAGGVFGLAVPEDPQAAAAPAAARARPAD